MQILVERFFHIDFILLDLLFCLIWIAVLLRQGYRLEFSLGLMGILVNFIVDFVIWFNVQGIRTLEGPIDPLLFFIYFSITYGMVEYSYVGVMFRVRTNRQRIMWTILLYGGWLISGLLSQVIPLNDTMVHVTREMSIYRMPQIAIVIVGFIGLLLLAKSWLPMNDTTYQRILYLFLVGILVHFGMESTLWLAGIRPSPVSGVLFEFLFNSFLEFNTGVPILYVLWTYLRSRGELGSIASHEVQ
ncbi:MAG: hypothetical protein JW779_05475 [Candidatus Thorarchaeota archaeon]|nr:hypothetical protein [Candidatus Thorarchaeota archaeon]